MSSTLKIGGKTFVTNTLTDKGQIKPGDILRNHYGEDLIVTAVKPYRRNGGGLTVSGLLPVNVRWASEPDDLSYLRFSHDIPFGYDVTHNRTHDTAENTDTATDADLANDLGMRG
jgi:hypothetical protein